MTKNLKNLTTLTLISTVLLACGSGAPRKPINELASHIELVSVNFQNASWKLRLTHRQKEDRLNNELTCGLYTENNNTLNFGRIKVPDLSYQLTETIDIPAMPANLPVPDQMPEKMDYRLDCELFSENYATERIVKNSTMHKIPGANASYR